MKAYPASILYNKVRVGIVPVVFASMMLASLTACQSNTYKINGSVEGLSDGDTLYITRDMETGHPSDTLIVSDGKFTASGAADSTMLCMIYSARNNEINAPFFVEPGNITIHLSKKPGGSTVGGTKINKQWQELNDSVMAIGKDINRIAEHIYSNNLPEVEQQQGMRQMEQLNERFISCVVRIAERNIDNEFGYFLLTYYPDEIIAPATRKRLIEQLPAEMRQRPAIQQIEKDLAAAAQTAEGTTLSDFSQPTPAGDELSVMSEVGQHQLTILDFWASWCGPCRQEMPEMLKLYADYKDRGLGIIGISLDNERDAWLTAINKLGLPWPQMSDLKGWENAAAQMFHITSIPHTIVVDQRGRILQRGLRSQQLRQFVEEQLGKKQ